MARRQKAAPDADAQAIPADNTASPDALTTPDASATEPTAAPAKPRRTRRPQAVIADQTEAVAPAPENIAEAAPEETAAPKPRTRRTRKPAAETGTENAPEPTEQITEVAASVEELAPITPPKRTRRTRQSAVQEPQPATFDDVPVSTADASDAAEDIEQVFDLPDTLTKDEQMSLDKAAMDGIRAESEAILEEVLGEPTPETNSKNRNRSRRGRGRGNAETNAPAPEGTPAPKPQANANGVLRKRGAPVLARTLPLPALAPTGDLPAPVPQIAPVLRKRGVRAVLATRRVLTPDGISVVSAEEAAALVGSVLRVPAPRREGDTSAPVLVPVVEPVAPEYAPLSAEVLERFPLVAIAKVNGLPELHINGEPITPAFLFVNTDVADEPEIAAEIAAREIKRAYSAGVRLFTLMAHLPTRRKSGDRRYDSIDAALAMVAENAPEARLLPRLIFSPPMSWERANPDEMAQFDSGEPGDVSIGSDSFWQEEAKDALRAAVEYLAQSDHAGRVMGVFLEHGEWFHPKGVGADRSPANTAAFRAFLRAHYSNSEVALRSAWHDGSVTFDTAEIPAAETLATTGDSGTVFLGERDRRIGDMHRYTSEMTATRIVDLAKIAKEASGNRLAVAASYGYTLEIARPNCGHYALGTVLASPDVDILTAPLSYSGRLPGGSAPYPLPVDSVHLAGKLFVCEDDTKTHLALRPTDDEYNPQIATEADTRAVHARNVGTAIAKGCGVSWMDLWGEGWLDDDATWEHLGGLLRVMETAAAVRRERTHPVPAPEVAVFVDEDSVFEVAANGDSPLLSQLIGHHRDTFARAGASVGYYLFSDLLRENFPESAKLMVFLNTFRLPLDVRGAIKARWQNAGRTFAWLFAPGVRETGNIAEFSETLGFQLRLQPWGSRTGTVVTDGVFVLTKNAKGERFGEEKRINPSLTVADPKAQILGEYVASGNPSLVFRKHPRWQSVFVGERDLPLPLVRGLFQLSGVPVATTGDDAATVAGDGFVSVHAPRDAEVSVFSPTRTESAVYDAATGELLAANGYGASIETVKGQTRLLFFAAPDELSARFAVTPEMMEAAPEAFTEADLPALATLFAFEAVPTTEARQPAPPKSAAPKTPPGPPAPAQPTRLYPVELSVSEEDIAQFEAALAGEIALLDKDADEGEPERKKRRRRRRRGGNNAEGTTDTQTDGEDDGDSDDDGDNETDLGDVFGLGALAQAATSFDADALLPLLSIDDSEAAEALGGGRLPSSHSLPVDLLADVMQRLFSLPELGDDTKPNGLPEPPRRPMLDELLPFSSNKNDAETPETVSPLADEEPETPETDPVLTEIVEVESEPEEAAADDAPKPETEAEPEAEPMGLLAEGAVRTRRSSGGGFAARSRRRAAERAPGGETNTDGGTEIVPDEAVAPDEAGESE